MVLTVLTLLGLLHGLVLLPVLLSILGPPPEVTIPSRLLPAQGMAWDRRGKSQSQKKYLLSGQKTGLNYKDPPYEIS